MSRFIILMVILAIVLNWNIAKEFEFIATEKGYCEKKYFWWTFWLGILGMLMVIALPIKAGRANRNA